MPEYAWKEESEQKIREIVRTLASEINTMGIEEECAEAFADELKRQHRTLQQKLVEMLVSALHYYGGIAGDAMYTDARNEASAKYCHETFPERARFPLI